MQSQGLSGPEDAHHRVPCPPSTPHSDSPPGSSSLCLPWSGKPSPVTLSLETLPGSSLSFFTHCSPHTHLPASDRSEPRGAAVAVSWKILRESGLVSVDQSKLLNLVLPSWAA